MALLDLQSLSSLLSTVSEQNTHKIGGKVTEEELALFWLICKNLSSKSRNFRAELFPAEKGRANNMNSPFTLVTATSNILNLSFCVERVEDAKAREKSGIKIQFRSENDIVEKFFSYELKKVDKDNARIYWLDL